MTVTMPRIKICLFDTARFAALTKCVIARDREPTRFQVATQSQSRETDCWWTYLPKGPQWHDLGRARGCACHLPLTCLGSVIQGYASQTGYQPPAVGPQYSQQGGQATGALSLQPDHDRRACSSALVQPHVCSLLRS